MTRREKIAAFKKEHSIETVCTLVEKGGPIDPWLACHMPSARTFGYGVTAESDLFDCFSKVGRLLEESGVASYGRTEVEAIREVCKACEIICNL